MKELTKQQLKVLKSVEVYLKKTGFPPTRVEICNELGFKSPNAAQMHLKALEKKDVHVPEPQAPEIKSKSAGLNSEKDPNIGMSDLKKP